jgi:hypothetical protein
LPPEFPVSAFQNLPVVLAKKASIPSFWMRASHTSHRDSTAVSMTILLFAGGVHQFNPDPVIESIPSRFALFTAWLEAMPCYRQQLKPDRAYWRLRKIGDRANPDVKTVGVSKKEGSRSCPLAFSQLPNAKC